ncbi:MAG: helix-turn-helix transcriptional regulator [Candidatus Micrarchaeia archaeon]
MLCIGMGLLLIFTAIIFGISIMVSLFKNVPLKDFNSINIITYSLFARFIVPLIGGFLLVLAGVFMINLQEGSAIAKRQKPKKQQVNGLPIAISRYFNKDEQRILELVKSHKEGMLQSDIVAITGYSKVKVHRVISMLEAKDMIVKSRFGITNKIFYKDQNFGSR